ncbi:DUF4190 domain-containing protein [Curtobacterium flaccumfaciens]|uniref:DUF4190 domain-containing protein n=1 Tax=Curtobacterium flaccumfaciens TaxID=2035 RepID=UPI00188B989A|nr:DUF4190 domain-containing protein [Curtobacterium flaccumfaciens]MBF4595742.1 DUF4190 domain-containing protein [Curtobacterium flaccumfaciens]
MSTHIHSERDERAVEARTNTLAIVSLVLGFVIPIAGIVTGGVALAQIRRSGELGKGLAVAGVTIGAVIILFWVAFIALFYATA